MTGRRDPSAGDLDRIDDLVRRHEALDQRERDDVEKLYEKINDLRRDVGVQLAPILARQHQIAGASGLLGLGVGALAAKILETILAAFGAHPPSH